MSGEAKASTHVIIHSRNFAVPKAFVEDEHPGGADSILEWKGKDATEAFEDAGHSTETWEMLVNDYSIVPVVYEGTKYYIPVEWVVRSHPGGKMNILKFYGQDITAEFARIGHSEGARRLLLQHTTPESARKANELIIEEAKKAPAAVNEKPSPSTAGAATSTPGGSCSLFKITAAAAIALASVWAYKQYIRRR